MQIDCQAYSTAQTYAQAEMNNQISNAVDALNISQNATQADIDSSLASARATDDYLTLTGGALGTYSVLHITSTIVSSPAYLELVGGSTGVQA